MSKIKDFFIGLNKSTKMTMLSCGCFVVLTLIILCFFVMFPITPSDRAISSLGREGLVYDGGTDEPAVTTTSVTVTEVTGTTTRTTTTHTSMSGFIGADVTTLGSGYLSGNVIPTGSYVYEPIPLETTTTTIAPGIEEPTVTTTGSEPIDPGISTDVPPEPTDPTEPPVDPTDPPVEPTDPPVTDIPSTPPEDPAAQTE